MERFVDDAQQLAHAVRVRLVSCRTFAPPQTSDPRKSQSQTDIGHWLGKKFSVMGLLFGIIFGVIRTGVRVRVRVKVTGVEIMG